MGSVHAPRARVALSSTLVVLALVARAPVAGVDLLYDFEGDAGGVATDKLGGDGAQNGTFQNNAGVTMEGAPFGAQAAAFDVPLSGAEGFNRIQIPGSTELGMAFTIAASVDFDNTGFTRLFTSYRGTGGVGADRIIVDFDPSGGVIPGVRAIINNTVVGTAAPPASLADPGYHHVAVTYDDGAVAIYVDGAEVASGTAGSGPVTMTQDLFFGEDPHDGGGSANEQFVGNVDDIVVLSGALSAEEIALVALDGVDGAGIAPGGGLAVWYDFEGDSGTTITDKFDADGAQDGIVLNAVAVDEDPANAAFGQRSAALAPFIPFSVIDVGRLGNLGSALTLAATINVPGGGHSGGGLARVFSTFAGSGSPAGRLILDVNPSASVADIGIRLILPDGTAVVAPDTFTVDENHHIAATYDAGDVRVYLDGVEVASGSTAGDVDLGDFPLRIGEDLGGGVNENFIGIMDDVLILGRALSAGEVATIAANGAAAVLGRPFEIFYDFEGDSGSIATDKLDGDGAQDGTLVNNVSFTTAGVPFGEQAAAFDLPPDPPVAPDDFNRIEIPGSTDLGTAFTIAAEVDYENTGFTRLFTSYRGTGGVGTDRIILDFDPSGGVIPGLRSIINNTVVQTSAPAAALADPGYHHVAVTYDDGAVALYVDGAMVASGTAASGPVTMTQNLFFGEDPHDGGGSANEQFVGNVDEILVLGRALSAADVMAVADAGVDGAGIAPGDGLAIYYDFEGDSGTTITDKFDADGAQDGIVVNDVSVDETPGNAARGSRSGAVGPFGLAIPFSVIDVGPVGSLGSGFTMAATINVPGGGHAGGGLARVFSTFAGSGSPAGRLILDVNPDADVAGIGIRLILPDGTAVVAPDMFTVDENHTIAATYDAGDVRLYLDGVEVASGSTAGDVDLGDFPLRIGEDLGGGVNENFIGIMDDVLILARALSPEDVARLTTEGAAAVISGEPPANTRPTAVIQTNPDPPVVQLAGGIAAVILDGSDSDDGDGGAQGLTFLWEKLGGPEGDVIADPAAAATEVTFSTRGVYEYSLTVDDGQAENARASARVSVTVLSEPIPIDILYDFEGDSGAVATDKLVDDGQRDGALFNNVSIVSRAEAPVPFGNRAARFEPPDLFSTLEIPGTLELGMAWTIAAHADYENTGFTRLFTSFRGTGPVGADRIILDFDPSGNSIPGVRAIVNNVVVQTTEPPAVLAEPGYHHFALRYNDGAVTVFVDGDPVVTGTAGSGPVTMTANLRFGEDPHDGGGSANEQFVGNVDDILVVGRALSDIDVSTLAAVGVRANLERAGVFGVHYSFEADDSGTTITDRFVMDGAQDGVVHGDVSVDEDAANAFAGEQSGVLAPLPAPFSIIEIGPVQNVGDQLTLAAVVNVPDGGFSGRGLTRLFSTYAGGGSPAGRLILDFNPDADVSDIGIRLIVPDGTAVIASDTFTVDEPHHIAATYNNGEIALYLDGTPVASGSGPGGDLDLGDFALRVGEDLGGAVNENLEGIADDVLVLGTALTPAEIAELADIGADRFFGLALPNNAPTAVITTRPDPAEVTIADGMASVQLLGGDSDDGDGGEQGLMFSWTKVSGPDGDAIATPDAPSTMVTFTQAGTFVYRLTVDDGQDENNTDSAEVTVTVLPEPQPIFVRGDGNADGEVDLSDASFIFNFLFLGGPAPVCPDAADSNDEGALSITSGIYVLNFLFNGGPPPPAPFPDCGEDPTADDLGECDYPEENCAAP